MKVDFQKEKGCFCDVYTGVDKHVTNLFMCEVQELECVLKKNG